MFFRRDPYYGYSPAAGCFGSLLAFLVIATILIVCAIYIGVYILIGLLIIGAIIGGLAAVVALFKALPQTIRDMNSQNYHGNKIVVVLKKIGYFFVCISKYSINNDWQYAKNAYQKFASKKALSFSKWVNLALAATVLIFGLLMLVAILFFAALFVASLIVFIINLILVAIVIMLGISLLCNMFFVMREAIRCGKKSFSPICFKFTGRCYFSDLLSVPKSFFAQLGSWIGTTWKSSINLLSNYKSWLNTKRWLWFPLAIAMIISCPISSILIIAVAVIILVVLSLLIYLVDAIWIIIKAIFRF